MSVKIDPLSIIHISLGIDSNGRVQKFFTNSCYNHMDKYVPMDIGDLRTDVTIKSDRITYESPYAHAQYVGIVNGRPVEHYTTPGTGTYWDEKMKSAEMQNVEKEVQNYIRRH